MLVLSRKENESVMVGDSEVIVLQVRGGTVRLGIRAPEVVKILRKELADTRDKEASTDRSHHGP